MTQHDDSKQKGLNRMLEMLQDDMGNERAPVALPSVRQDDDYEGAEPQAVKLERTVRAEVRKNLGIAEKSNLKITSISMSPAFHKELREYSFFSDVPMTRIIEAACRDYMKRNPIKKR